MEELETFMAAALEEARRAGEAGEVPVGAVVVREGKILCSARNRREEWHDPTAHAEILALRQAGELLQTRHLGDCTLFVTLEPCPMCAGALMMAELGKCYFGCRDLRQGCAESLYCLPGDPAFYHRVPCVGGLLEEDCARLLKTFFENKRGKADDH